MCFYESGLSINVLYAPDGLRPKRAVGVTLSEGMGIPEELNSVKFARQKSKLAGTIRGSYFVVRGEYPTGLVPPRAAVTCALRARSVRRLVEPYAAFSAQLRNDWG